MTQLNFGRGIGIHFYNEEEYYETLGVLSKNPPEVVVYTHDNDKSGAWAGQGKLETYVGKRTLPPALQRAFVESGDNRLSVTSYVKNLIENHKFSEYRDPTGKLYTLYRYPRSVEDVKTTIPRVYLHDFDRGYNW